MGSIYPGIFSKEVIMFYGEEIDYSIKEYSNEYPEGKVVDNYSEYQRRMLTTTKAVLE